MPVQLIRKVRDHQPTFPVKIDWSNPVTRDLVFSFEASVGQRDLVSKQVGENLGSGVSLSAGKFGRSLDFSGAQANRSCSFGIHMGLMGATSATWDILVYFNSANPSANLFGQWDFNLRWLLQISGGALIWVSASDASGNRRRFDSSGSLLPSSGWYRITASWRGGSGRFLVINGIDKTSTLSEINNTATEIAPTNSGDYLQIGMANGGTPLAGNVCFARAFKRGLSLDECFVLQALPWKIFAPETIPLFFPAVTAQFLRPIADVSNSGWTPSTGGDLFSCIGETVRNDSTYISATAPGAICEVLLGTSSGDPLSSINHLPRIVMSAGSGGIILRLKQGATLIKAWTYASLAGSDTLYEPSLTSGEIDSISDYTDLRLEMETTA